VRLNCNEDAGSSQADQQRTQELKPLRVKLHDAEFNPYAGKKYRLVAEGLTREGTTGADGSVEQQVPKATTAAQVTLWLAEWPTGRRLSWTIALTDAFPPSSSLAGAMERLRNLGYEPGADDKDMDAPTQRALLAFQRDHALPETGALDGPTCAQLGERHGH